MATQTRSVTFTILILAGVVIAILGAIATVFGLGGETTLDVEMAGGYTLKTTSSGLALVVLGGVISAFGIAKMPEGTQVFAGPTRIQRIRRLQVPVLVLGGVALLALVVSLILSG